MADDPTTSDLTNTETSSSVIMEGHSQPKKRKTHRLKQRFQVVKKLGQGTYGKVQLAINKETGQEVAIKTIKKSKVANSQDLMRIRREIQIMSSINHPNIIHIFEVFENKEKIVLVMQYASGGELYEYVSYHKMLSDTEARRVFRQIATAIYYCHKNKICHRDLKLENILLDEKGNAKIADFGLSNVFDDKHFLKTFCGSPLYASPEIVRGLPYYGSEVDCWSLGVLLYTLVYGAMPFDGSNFKKLVKQISEANYFEPQEKSAASHLIKRLLTPDPKKRATIIDICTDKWVNLDCENCLLQVSEDLSNLTKYAVRLDVLLSLAPVSPTSDEVAKTKLENKRKNSETSADIESSSNKRSINTSSSNDLAEKKTKVDQQENKLLQKEDETIKKNADTSFLNDEEKIENKSLDGKLILETKEEILENNEEKKSSNNKVSIKKNKVPSESSLVSNESSSSISKKPGRLSIPKLWDSEQEKTLQNNQSRKKIFIPVGLKVSEARQVLERRCSLESNSLIKRNDSSNSSNDSNITKINVKKYTNRSLSYDLSAVKQTIVEKQKSEENFFKKRESNEPISEINKNEKIDSSHKIENFVKSGSDQVEYSSKPSTPISEEDKSLAKQIIQKNIAKAKLLEKLQTFNNIELETVTSPTSLKSINTNETDYSIASENVAVEIQTNVVPITRSYKKVTFTKDGACITETGEYYEHEDQTGFKTKVEKTSKIINEPNQSLSNEYSSINIKRSDSQSSTGSIDIFDDIFENHWTGDAMFSNLKNLLSDFMKKTPEKPRNGKQSLRTRGESLERSNWFSEVKNRHPKLFPDLEKKYQNISNEFDQSFFSSKSFFSNQCSFKSSFDKSFSKDFSNFSISSLKSEQTELENFELTKLKKQFNDNSINASLFEKKTKDSDFDSSKKRVEQWLSFENDKPFDFYSTLRPQNFRRFNLIPTFKENEKKNSDSNQSETHASYINQNKLKKTFFTRGKDKFSAETFETNDNDLQKDIDLNDSHLSAKQSPIIKSVDSRQSIATLIESNQSSVNLKDLKIEEPSSLLEQLRTFGYKELVNRRLSDVSLTDELIEQACDNLNKSSESNGEKQSITDQQSEKQTSIENESYSSKNLSCFNEVSTFSSTNLDSSLSESVQERIHRKSYYSRFNDTLNDCRQRRRSATRFNEFNEIYSSGGSNFKKLFKDSISTGYQTSLSFDSDKLSSKLLNKSSIKNFEKSKLNQTSFSKLPLNQSLDEVFKNLDLKEIHK